MKHILYSTNQKDMEQEIIQKIKEEGKMELLKEILLDFARARLEGDGYDFYFVLNTKLDELRTPAK